jgi:hypothetical protein
MRRDFTPAQQLGFRCQSAALVITEPKPSSAHLLTQNAILLSKIIDDLQLTLIHPAGNRDHQEPERIQRRKHRIAHYRRSRHTPANPAISGRFSFRTLRRHPFRNRQHDHRLINARAAS